MKILWPRNLIEEIAYRRTILFLGSGISSLSSSTSGVSPKTWHEFLTDAVSLLNRAEPREIEFINRMLQQENYLLALQAIQEKCDPGQYRHFLHQSFSEPNYLPSPTHERIKEIDTKIVITTNFDKIYDSLCNEHGYSVATYQEVSKILSNLKSTNNLIIKAHGTIDDPEKMIFSQQQYFTAQTESPDFYEVLQALFLTNTVLFIGYNLGDPDIQLGLQAVRRYGALGTPHYIVVKEGTDKEIRNYWLRTFNVVCLEYGPTHDDLPENIDALREDVLLYRESKLMP